MIAHNAYTDHGSMTLDEETCTVTYDGSLDKVCVTGTEVSFNVKKSDDCLNLSTFFTRPSNILADQARTRR